MPKLECQTLKDGLLGDTLNFLWNTVIDTSTESEAIPSGSAIRNFDFIKASNIGRVNVYEFISGNGTSIINGIMPVYFLPWGADAGYHIVLDPGGGPDIMLTARMDSCSVGYVRSADGAVRVSHHNMMSAGAAMDSQQRQSLSFAGNNVIHRSDYRFNDDRQIGSGNDIKYKFQQGFAFAYGVRKGDGWHMYRQFVHHITMREGRTDLTKVKWAVTEALEF